MSQTIIEISHLRSLMLTVCEQYGLSDSESSIVIENYLEAEILNKRTHGISKFCYESQYFHEKENTPSIVVDTGALIKLDGNREIGPLAANYCVELVSQRAKEYGISIVGITNIQRYGILKTWAEKFSESSVFGLVLNTCEPAMVGYQGKTKVLGTNPLAFSMKTPEQTHTVDMATSKVAMSLIWQAKRENTELPNDTFLDENGNFTTDPSRAKAVNHFDGIKGYSIALLIQLLSGSVFGFKMGAGIQNMYDIGYVFLAIDPSKATTNSSMLNANQSLVDELINSGATIPGSRSVALKKQSKISIDQQLLNELEQLGEKAHES